MPNKRTKWEQEMQTARRQIERTNVAATVAEFERTKDARGVEQFAKAHGTEHDRVVIDALVQAIVSRRAGSKPDRLK